MKLHNTLPAIFLLVLLPGCSGKYDELDLSVYMYRDTRNLVRFVYDAACIVETEGDTAIEYFKDNRTDYCSEDYYIYIYDMNATNLFHAGMPEFEGQNLLNILDIAGNRSFALAAAQLENQDRVWQVFMTRNRYERQPVKKVIYLRKTVLSGETLFVGAITDLLMTP